MTIKGQDVKDALQYSFALTEQTLSIRGVELEIWHDQFAENPYTWGDCMAPALWFYESIKEYGDSDLENVIRRMSPAFVSRHWRKIEAIIDNVDTDEPKAIQIEHGGDIGSIRQEYYAECLSDMRSECWGYICDYFEAIAALYRLQGIEANTFQSNGHCQGDSARGLIVHLPEWKERVGFNGDAAQDMQSECDTYTAWAWGEIYGFTVDEDETCGGFYGNDVGAFCEHVAHEINAVLNERAIAFAANVELTRPDMYQGVMT